MFLASYTLPGQEATRSPVFDAASIKPSNPDSVGGSTFSFTSGGGFAATNATLKGLIESAYDVRDFQISGGPGWLDSDRYDLTAKSSPGASGTTNETRQRLQSLLSERFQLRVHRETKDLPEYALVVGKGGAKLREGEPANGPAGIQRECGRMTGTGASIANLTVYLSRQLDRPAVDKTDLAGRYDFQFSWTPDSGPCAGASSDAPSLFTALQEELGLKLESTKGPVEVIVVDGAEKASAN